MRPVALASWPLALLLAASGCSHCAEGNDPRARPPSPAAADEARRAQPPARAHPPAADGEADAPTASRTDRSDFGNIQTSVGEAAGLHYLEVVAGGPPEAPMPLVIGLHGLGDRPRLPYPPYEGLPTPVRLVAPRAPDPHGRGFSWFPVRARSDETQRLARAMRERAAQLARFIDHLQRQHTVRGKAIVTGFSQGGMLTYALAVHHPERVGAAFPLAGWLPPPLIPEPLEPDQDAPPIRAMHTRDDPVVPYGPTRVSVQRLDALGFDIELRSFEHGGHTMTDPMNALMHRWLASATRAVHGAGDGD